MPFDKWANAEEPHERVSFVRLDMYRRLGAHTMPSRNPDGMHSPVAPVGFRRPFFPSTLGFSKIPAVTSRRSTPIIPLGYRIEAVGIPRGIPAARRVKQQLGRGA